MVCYMDWRARLQVSMYGKVGWAVNNLVMMLCTCPRGIPRIVSSASEVRIVNASSSYLTTQTVRLVNLIVYRV